MTITAESDSPSAGWFCICIRMADEAYSSRGIVPDSFFVRQKSAFVCSRVSSFYAVIIEMTFHAGRVSALYVVARFTGLDISFSEFRMQSSARIDAKCRKSWLKMAFWHESGLQISAVLVTGAAEFHGVMTGFTFKTSLVRIETVCILIIQSMDIR